MHRPTRYEDDGQREEEEVADAHPREVARVAPVRQELVAANAAIRPRRLRRVHERQREKDARQRRMMQVRRPGMMPEDVEAGDEVEMFVARLRENAMRGRDAPDGERHDDCDS